jgi:hypothetical protein
MTNLEVKQRVLKDGKPLDLDLFTWDEKTRTFSSPEDCLVLDFSGIPYCTFKTGSDCTFDTGPNCTFKTDSDCTFDTGPYCTFDTGPYCTFKTGPNCTFDTGSDCTFKTSSYCTFKTGPYCTFDTGPYCVIVRRDIFEVIQPLEGEKIQLCPGEIKGFLSNGYLNRDESLGEYVILDKILSKVISRKGSVLKVHNYGQAEESFIIEQDGISSHGKTLKEAKDSFIYKISNRDTSKYEGLKLDSVLTKDEAIKMYRVITGASQAGTRYFVEQQKEVKDYYTIQEIINLTKSQYGNECLTKFFS